MYRSDWTETLAELFGEREAIFDVASDRRVTYADLAADTGRAAAHLVALGVGRGDRVAVLAKNRVESLVLMFACGRVGAIFAPLNWRLQEPELAFVLEDSEPSALFFDDAHAHLAGRLSAQVETRAVDIATLGDVEHEVPRPADISGEDPWILLYTSGTTGHPKGALLPHRQVTMNALNTIVALQLTAADRTVTYTPLFHTGALHVLTTPLLSTGGSLILTDGFDPDEVLRLTDDEGCTLLFGVPTTFEMMAERPAFATADLSRVRFALCGGAPCPCALIERYAAREVCFKQGYGLTEVGPNCLNLPEAVANSHAGAAGRPNLHVIARIVDDDGVVEGPGRGELCLAGPCVFLGYWRRPDANATCFDDDGFFMTGDIVERDAEGYYSIVDRKKDMFISGGENVYPAEIEKALAGHPAVRGCAVIGVDDARWGEVGRAFIEVRGDIVEDELRHFLKERLAAYKVPKRFVVVDELPRNPSGKVVKARLGPS